jgi:DNA-binding XRE family transcriptional regulator
MEIETIRQALLSADGNKTRAAQALGMSRVALVLKLRKYAPELVQKTTGRPKGNVSSKPSSPIGQLIKDYRKLNSVGMKEISSALGVSESHMNHVEAGKLPMAWNKIPLLAHLVKQDVRTVADANLKSTAAYKQYALSIKE